jgi:hypothetical protein
MDDDSLQAAGNALTALAGKLDAAQTDRAWQALIDLVGKTTDEDAFQSAVKGFSLVLERQENRAKRDSMMNRLLSLLLNRCRDGKQSPTAPDLAAMFVYLTSSEPIAEHLGHLGARRDLREALLRRLEEIERHDGRPVFSELDAAWPDDREWEKLDERQKAEWNARREALPPRKFLTVHDATAWLAKNRPDIDLEAPPKIDWPVER